MTQNSKKEDIHDLLEKRWSPRAFSDKPVKKEVLKRLFEAARWAPSSFNEQPWRFIVGIKGEETYERIIDSMGSFNQKWARTAPVVILTLTKDVFTRNDKENKHSRHDVGLAVAQMTVQATHEGVFLHQMAGFSEEKAKENFDIPEGFSPVTTIAMGYKGDKDALPGDMAEQETPVSKRKPLEELVFGDGLKNPLPL